MPTEDQIQQWKEKHGAVFCVTVGESDYYIRRPTRPEYKRFIDTVARSTYDASNTLVLDCLLEPSKQELMKHLEQNPGIALLISAEVQDRIGANLTVSTKNL